jgi:FKBP-type peptidyl-prolyl cis-trans isomerase SlpA
VNLKAPRLVRGVPTKIAASLANLNSLLKRVAPESFLTLHYRLSGPDGDVFLDTFADKPATLSLGQGALAPAIEACLLGLVEGQSARFDLAPGAAFGERNPQLVQSVGRKVLDQFGDPDEAFEVGDVVRFPTPDGRAAYAGIVREVADAALLLDFNHPLAGRPVTFEVQLIGVL